MIVLKQEIKTSNTELKGIEKQLSKNWNEKVIIIPYGYSLTGLVDDPWHGKYVHFTATKDEEIKGEKDNVINIKDYIKCKSKSSLFSLSKIK